jgi:hypothetical protein
MQSQQERTSEACVDPGHLSTVDELRAQVEEAVAEGREEGQVGEPVKILWR